MSWRTNVILFVLAAGLSAYAFFFENTAAPWVRLGKHFRDLEPRDVYEIEISQPALVSDAKAGVDARPVVLRHEAYGEEEPTWWVVEPIRARALYPRVQGITFLIADLDRKAEVVGPIDPFDEGDSVLRVRFKARTGESATIEVGKDYPDPNLDFSYVRVDDQVFATSTEFRKNAQVSLDGLRSRALFPIALPDASRVTVELAGRDGSEPSRRVLERDGESSRWRLREPLDALADRALTESLVNALNAWRVEKFLLDDLSADVATPGGAVTPARSLSEWGLEEPRASITVTHRDGRSFTLDVGGDLAVAAAGDVAGVPPTPLVYARHRGQPFLYAVSDVVARSLESDVEVLRSRFLFDVGLEEFERLRATVHRGEHSGRKLEVSALLLSDGTRSWKARGSADGQELPGDRRLIEGLLKEFRKLKIERFLTASEIALPSAGLQRPWATVELWATDGHKVEYQIGARSQDPADQGLDVFHIVRPGEPGGYLVLSRMRRFLEEGIEAFRNRYISALDPLRILEIEFYSFRSQGVGRRWTLSRLPGKEWLLSDATPRHSDRILDVDLVDQCVETLAADSFRVLRYEPAITDFPGYELELTRPAFGFSLRHVDMPDDQSFRKLVVGRPVAGAEREYYGRVDVPALPPFVIDDELPSLLKKVIDHLDRITRS